MKYFIRGKDSVTLTQNDFIAKGGEGNVYGKGNLIYKIYLDPIKMIPEPKIQELQILSERNILKPKDVILNNKNTPVGFTMDWIRHTFPLCKLFTNDFRNQIGATDDGVLELIETMKSTTHSIHQANCLVVDGNEFNYLVDDNDLTMPYFIDVDSYQTPNFPATAIMPSIRDWHSKTFSPLTDWFSFAIIACQLFVGIHPFKGKHPDYKKADFERRMKDNISIFNPKVTVPPAARDFSIIPTSYFSWFLEVFEKGKRLPPPALPGQIVIVAPKITVIQSSQNFEITLQREYDDDLRWYCAVAGISVASTGKQIMIDRVGYPVRPLTDVIFTHKSLTPVFAWIEGSILHLNPVGKGLSTLPVINATHQMVIDNTLFVRHEGNLIEIDIDDMGDKVIPTVKHVWNIMPHASELFTGVIYQNVLGKPYLVIPIPKHDGASSCIIKGIPELEGSRVIDAKHDSGVCILICHKNHAYHRMVLKFNDTYDRYECRMTLDIDPGNANFITLSNGIVISLNEDGAMEIFSKRLDKPDVNVIKDSEVDASMKLCKDGNTVMFFKHNQLYRIRMSKTSA